jgi:hypothetical protein
LRELEKNNFDFVPGVPGSTPTTIGAMKFITQKDMEGDYLESQLGGWVMNFHEKLGHKYKFKPRYFELRPYSYA